MELNQEQMEEVARVWEWQVGQLPKESGGARIAEIRDDAATFEGEWVMDYLLSKLHPNLDDPVTADGLLRTARKVWSDPKLSVYWSWAGKWKACAHRYGDEHIFEGGTEQEALLAAILAEPSFGNNS